MHQSLRIFFEMFLKFFQISQMFFLILLIMFTVSNSCHCEILFHLKINLCLKNFHNFFKFFKILLDCMNWIRKNLDFGFNTFLTIIFNFLLQQIFIMRKIVNYCTKSKSLNIIQIITSWVYGHFDFINTAKGKKFCCLSTLRTILIYLLWLYIIREFL